MISGMLGAAAYLAMAWAVHEMFLATERSVLLRRRRLIIALMLAGAAVQVAQVAALFRHQPALLPPLQGLAGLCLLGLPISFWPVVSRLKHGHLRVLNRRLRSRAERAEAAAAAAARWLDMAEQTGHVGHWRLTVPENRLVWSDEVYRIHGLWREHYTPRLESALAALHPLDGKRVASLLQEAVAEHNAFEVAARLRRPDGEIRHVILRGLPSVDECGRVDEISGVLVDVSEPRRPEGAFLPYPGLRDLPMEDRLTGLADRKQFDLCLTYEFKRAVRSRKPLGLVLVDIDHFRALNAFYGRMDGDQCLRTVAQAVQARPRRTGDVVARFEEAQIAVLLPMADTNGAMRVAAQIIESIRVLGLPNAGHETGLLSVSCGAGALAGIDDVYNPLELIRRAQQALAEAKASGGNRVAGHRPMELLEILQRG